MIFRIKSKPVITINGKRVQPKLGTLWCSLHGRVTDRISETEMPDCAKRHRKAGCPLGLTWKTSHNGEYRA